MASSQDLAKERYWRGIIQRFEASGLGVRQFCEREKLSKDRLYWWRRTLRRRDQGKVRRPVNGKTGKPVRDKTVDPVRGKAGETVGGGSDSGSDATFLPVNLPISMGGPIEVVHPRGHVIRVPSIFDPAALGRILAAIDASAGSSGARVT